MCNKWIRPMPSWPKALASSLALTWAVAVDPATNRTQGKREDGGAVFTHFYNPSPSALLAADGQERGPRVTWGSDPA